jgi:hypothetical protein
MHRAGKARIDTPRLSTVMALNGKANLALPLHADAWQGAWALSLERLEHVLGLGMLRQAVNPAKATANTSILSYIDLPQPLVSYRLVAVCGNRFPYTVQYHIIFILSIPFFQRWQQFALNCHCNQKAGWTLKCCPAHPIPSF